MGSGKETLAKGFSWLYFNDILTLLPSSERWLTELISFSGLKKDYLASSESLIIIGATMVLRNYYVLVEENMLNMGLLDFVGSFSYDYVRAVI